MKKNIFLCINSLDHFYYKNKKHSKLFPHLHNLENLINLKNQNYKIFDKKNLLERKKYLDKLRNKVFNSLYKELNKINMVNKNKKYWQIILLPWLFQFLDRSFHIYEMIKFISKNKKYKINDFNYKDFILPSSYEHLNDIYSSDEWNYQISLEIIKYNFQNKFEIKKKNNYLISNKIYKINKKYNKVFFFKKKISSKLFTNQKILFIKGYLGKLDYTRLNLIFKQLPNNYEIYSRSLKYKRNLELRNKKKLIFKTENEFENFVKDKIFNHLPSFFLELFKHYNNENIGILPEKPKVIFNINRLWWFTLYMFYSANKISFNRSKLIGYQHGCNYYLYDSFFHEHEIKSCDLYLTWGWKLYKNTKRLGLYKTLNRSKNGDKILIVNRSASKYFINDPSNLNENEWSRYLKELVNLPKNISPNLSKKLVYRMHPSDTWNEKKFLKKKLRNINFDSSDLEKSIKSSKIVICTFLDTTFLNCISSNIPVLTIFDYKRANLSRKNFLLLKDLQKQKILFEDFNDLCAHINKNYYNIESWWNSKKIQNSINKFSNIHALSQNKFIEKLNIYIKEMIK